MIQMIIKTIKSRRWMLLILCMVSVALLWLYTALMPSLAESSEAINQLLSTMPKEFLAAFNVESQDMSSFSGIIASKQYDMVWPFLSITLALSLASAALAGEIEKGTMQILLALPLSRGKLYIAKYIGGLLMMITFTLVSILPGIPLAELYEVDYEINNFYYFALNALAFSVFVFSLGFFVSAIVSESSRANFPVLGFVLLSYVLNLIALLKEDFSALRYLSIFHYYSPTSTLVKGELEPNSLILFFSLSIIFVFLGYLFFRKRDIRF